MPWAHWCFLPNHLWQHHPSRSLTGFSPEVRPRSLALVDVLGLLPQLQAIHAKWLKEALRAGNAEHDPFWSESLAVSRREFVKSVQVELEIKARYREVADEGYAHVPREPAAAYAGYLDEQDTGLSSEQPGCSRFNPETLNGMRRSDPDVLPKASPSRRPCRRSPGAGGGVLGSA